MSLFRLFDRSYNLGEKAKRDFWSAKIFRTEITKTYPVNGFQVLCNKSTEIPLLAPRWKYQLSNWPLSRGRLRASPSRIPNANRNRICTSHSNRRSQMWHLWRSQSVTIGHIVWIRSLRFSKVFFSKTGLVTIGHNRSQSVTSLRGPRSVFGFCLETARTKMKSDKTD